jgi:hypothetical protein
LTPINVAADEAIIAARKLSGRTITSWKTDVTKKIFDVEEWISVRVGERDGAIPQVVTMNRTGDWTEIARRGAKTLRQ